MYNVLWYKQMYLHKASTLFGSSVIPECISANEVQSTKTNDVNPIHVKGVYEFNQHIYQRRVLHFFLTCSHVSF